MALVKLHVKWDDGKWSFTREETNEDYSVHITWDGVGITSLIYNLKEHNADKIESLLNALAEVKDEPGDVFEAGVCHGSSLFALSYGARAMEMNCLVVGCDPGEQPKDDFMPDETGDMWNSQKQDLGELIGTLNHVHAKNVGFYPLRIQDVKHPAKLRFMHADTDNQAGTYASLMFARAHDCPIMVVDDYPSQNCPGVARAIAEFQQAFPDQYSTEFRGDHCILRRNASPSGCDT